MRSSITELPVTRHVKERHDVFQALDQNDCIDLTERFEQMKTTESAQLLTDGNIKHTETGCTSANNCQSSSVTMLNRPTRNKFYNQLTTCSQIHQIPVSDGQADLLTFLKVAAAAPMIFDIAASVENLSVSSPLSEKEIPGMEYVLPDVRRHSCMCHLETHLSKMIDRLKRKVPNVSPYGISRTQPLTSKESTLRRRRHGVNRKGKSESAVRELSTLMEKLGTSETNPSDESTQTHHTVATLSTPQAQYCNTEVKCSTSLEVCAQPHTSSKLPNELLQVTSGVESLDMSGF